MDLSGADPSTINAPDVHPLENRQHHGTGPHPEGRRPQRKGSPRGGRKDPPSCSPAFIPSEENIQADAASRFQSIPDWQLAPRVFHQISSLRGPPLINLFASRRSAQMRRFFAWNAADNPETIDALSQKWDFNLAYLFPPIPVLKRVIRKLESSRGTYLLVTPYWDAQTWFASLQALAVEDVRRLPTSAVIDLTTWDPPSNLVRLFLVVWTISGCVGESTPSRIDNLISSRQDGSDPQKTAMSVRGSSSRTSSALPPFRSIRRL
jgi:hypothetical protein